MSTEMGAKASVSNQKESFPKLLRHILPRFASVGKASPSAASMTAMTAVRQTFMMGKYVLVEVVKLGKRC